MDVHVFGKHTLGLYRNLFSFTGTLIICMTDRVKVKADMFDSVHSFL